MSPAFENTLTSLIEQATHLLQPLSNLVWGWPTITLLLGTGVYVMLVLGFIPLRRLPHALGQLFGTFGHDVLAKGDISHRAALWTALAATVGTGNIAGVATAITLGGPGAVFWMWVSGVLGIGLKYAETTLGVHYRVHDAQGHVRGGPMYYITSGAGLPMLGTLYAVALAFAAFSVGGMIQSNSMADVMATSFGMSPLWVGALVTIAAAAIMIGGLKRIANFANVLVPFMIGLFVLAGTVILLLNVAYIPEAFRLIWDSALNGTAAAGGFAGAAVMAGMRYGLARGIFSNESGLGSAAIVAAPARTRHPAEQGFIAMTQTFIDTMVVCTFTAMVILVSGAWKADGLASGGAALSAYAFDAGLGFMTVAGGIPLGGAIVAVSLFLFAFTTVVGWGYYGQQGAVYVWGRKAAKPYLYVYLLLTFVGAALLEFAPTVREGVAVVWLLADVAVGLMLIPNLIALLILAPTVRRITLDWLNHLKHGVPLKHAAFHAEAGALPKPTRPVLKTLPPVAKAATGKTAAVEVARKQPKNKKVKLRKGGRRKIYF